MSRLMLEVVVILGTVVGGMGSLLLGGKWLVGSIVSTELNAFAEAKLAPLNTTLASLDKTAALLTQSFDEAKVIQIRDHLELQKRDREMHRAVIALEALVKEHDIQLRLHASAIAELQRGQPRRPE